MTKNDDKLFDRQAKRYGAVLGIAVKKFAQMDGTQAAAAFAHYAFFSLFPLIMLFVTVISVVIGREQACVEVLTYLKSYIPISADMGAYIFGTIIGVVNARGQASAVALLMLVWSAMQFFTTLVSATNQAWGAQAFNWWRLPFKSLVLLGIMVGAVLFSVAIPILVKMAGDSLLLENVWIAWPYAWAGYFIPALVGFVGLGLFFKLAPNRPTRFDEIWFAALCASVLLQAAQSLFVIYLENFALFNVVYGAFGGIMALLLWIYLSGCIVIFGACLCAAQAEPITYKKNQGLEL